MIFLSRSYHSDSMLRPRPVVVSREEAGLYIIMTTWSGDIGEKTAQDILERLEGLADQDVTQVRAADAALGSRAAFMRSVLAMKSREIFQTQNSKKAKALVEILVLHFQQQEVAWASVGQPNLFLHRKQRVIPLTCQLDQAMVEPGLPPLASHGLGLEDQIDIQAGSIRREPQDAYVCIAHPTCPISLIEKSDHECSFQDLNRQLIDFDPNQAYWLGLFSQR